MLEEVKKNIIEHLGGYPIEPSSVRDYIENPGEFTEDYTPTMWLFNFTEIEMPENELGGVYCAPVEKEIKSSWQLSSPKDCLIFLRTKDGINVIKVYAMFPFEIDDKEMDRINKWIGRCFPKRYGHL